MTSNMPALVYFSRFWALSRIFADYGSRGVFTEEKRGYQYTPLSVLGALT